MSVYDLKSVNLPRASGALLRLLVGLIESPVTRPLVLPGLLGNAGVLHMRALRVDEPPTYQPLYPTPEGAKGDPTPLDAIPELPRRAGGFRFPRVRDYAEAYRSGATTPETVAARALDAIQASDRLDPPLRAIIAVQPEDVMAQARAATERIRAGRALGPFDGVPVAIKDEVDMLPYPTRVGTRFLGSAPAGEDSTVVARLRAAGAVLIGKANMHEIGIEPTGVNPHYGAARNPYNPAHDTGGSSSGSAAAVAAGLGPVALGADGGGSIRIPAAHCGLVGLKPTFGRICEYGAAPLCWSVAHLGPIAATAEDAALMFAALAGPDSRDRNTLGQPPLRLDDLDATDLRGVKLGLYREWFGHAQPDVVRACETLLGGLASLGAEIVEIEIPELYNATIAHALTILSEMAAGLDRHDRAHRRDYGLSTRVLLGIARAITSRDYVQAQRIRTRTIQHFDAALRQVDAIVTPTSAITAPAYVALPEGESNTARIVEIMRFINPANFTGLPAISVPAGTDSAGLPIGLHLMGRAWEEGLLLRLAYAAEGLVERRKPAVWYDLLSNERLVVGD